MTDKTLTRIAALLRKAESTDNTFEADTYMEAAQRLATAASVDLAVARAHIADKERRTTPTQREIVIGEAGKRGLRTYVELFVAIARANDITCDVARNSTRVFAYGFDTDLDTAHALYASLIVQMVRASDEFIKSGAYTAEQVKRFSTSRRRWEVAPVSPITARLSFQRAFAARIGRRLKDAKDAVTAQAVRADRRSSQRGALTGTALVLRNKEIELVDHYRSHSTARGSWRGSSASAGYSPHAARAGDGAAKRARIGTERPIGGAHSQIRR
ncbi:MAG: DUF2786 domain-containing protein [Nakamurella sp.]